MGILFALLFLVGFSILVMKVFKDKGWQLPAGLTAFFAGAAYWARDVGEKITSWF